MEHIPTPLEDYTGDKSAFDAMILVDTPDSRKGLICIETKYTDLLGSNTASDSEIKNQLVSKGDFFNDELKRELREKNYKQIHRNFLLTYAYARKHGCEYFVNVVISPEEDSASVREIEEMKSKMTRYAECIMKIGLKEFVGRGERCGNEGVERVMGKFWERYLGY